MDGLFETPFVIIIFIKIPYRVLAILVANDAVLTQAVLFLEQRVLFSFFVNDPRVAVHIALADLDVCVLSF